MGITISVTSMNYEVDFINSHRFLNGEPVCTISIPSDHVYSSQVSLINFLEIFSILSTFKSPVLRISLITIICRSKSISYYCDRISKSKFNCVVRYIWGTIFGALICCENPVNFFPTIMTRGCLYSHLVIFIQFPDI